MSRISRSMPRSSDSDQFLLLLAACRSRRPSRSISIDASCAASGVRNSCEMLPSTVSRARRAASSSVSSRITCTCWLSTGAALVMTMSALAVAPVEQRLGAAAGRRCARAQDRAVRLAGRGAVGSAARPQHVAAEAADALSRLDAAAVRTACGFM